ncbi:hypothetical protein [Kitasatospora brasiliensis]|uniref:hypothetical protein n=1 Tax=Kitasatospora brasiliensis TaxID=3058040 RepID=UPI00292E84C0|nr:hypothetical protein [Kitasatospora sp. K002]
MLVFTVLGLLYLSLPVVCWAFLARTRVVGAAVLAVLVGLAVALFGLEKDWWFTRAAAEVETGYPLAAGLVVLVGGLAERRLRGPRPAKEFHHPVGGSIAAFAVQLLAAAAIAFGYRLFSLSAFFPNTAEVAPPPGLTVTRVDQGYCGSNFCARTLTIGGAGDPPAAEVEARMRAALTADGWSPGRDGALVRPHGWLLDRRLSEIHLAGTELDLAGSESVNGGR